MPDKNFHATLGIDFGTTNSCISYINENQHPVIIPNPEGSYTTPTCMYFDLETKDILFGVTAESLLHSSHNALFLPNIVTNVKRLVGMTYQEWSSNLELQQFFSRKGIKVVNEGEVGIQIQYNNTINVLSINYIIQSFMRYLKSIAEDYLGACVSDCVITVPAYFTDFQRSQMKFCCESVGLNVLRIINEPTAAALAYGLEKLRSDSTAAEQVLVIDCGGGTTDISLVFIDYEDQMFEVRNVRGDNFLGGEDVTNAFVSYVIDRLQAEKVLFGKELSSKQLNRLRNQCEKLKQQLSYQMIGTLVLESFASDKDVQLNISRETFINVCGDFFQQLKQLIQTTVLGYSIDKVVLVGGTTRIPYISDICRLVLGQNIQICNTLDPDQTVSIGAAVQGYLLQDIQREFDMTVIDVIPMSLGIEMVGGLMSVIVSKNTPLPTSRTQTFTNSEDHITELDIKVYQGDRRLVKDNHCLATFKLTGLDPSCKKGDMNIKVTFNVDADGILRIQAEETTSKSTESITINVQKRCDIEKAFGDLSLNDINDDYIFQDSYKSNQILAKLELYDTFKYLLTFYHENKHSWTLTDFQDKMLNALFNKVFRVIKEYEKLTPNQIQHAKTCLESEFHSIILSSTQPIHTNNFTQTDIGSTEICDL